MVQWEAAREPWGVMFCPDYNKIFCWKGSHPLNNLRREWALKAFVVKETISSDRFFFRRSLPLVIVFLCGRELLEAA